MKSSGLRSTVASTGASFSVPTIKSSSRPSMQARRRSDARFLRPDEIDLALRNLREPCDPSFAIDGADEYAAISTMPHAPVFRAICAANWFHVDGSNGVIIEQLDRSRRAYRWLFAGLHTLNFPFLAAHSALRTVLIVFFCGCGFVFSVTGIVLAQRRIRSLWWRS